MVYTGTDGRVHLSQEEAQQTDLQFFVIDDPYPDPKYYPGDAPMPDATQAQINDVVNQWPHVLEAMYQLTRAASGIDPTKSAEDARTQVNAIDKNKYVFG